MTRASKPLPLGCAGDEGGTLSCTMMKLGLSDIAVSRELAEHSARNDPSQFRGSPTGS